MVFDIENFRTCGSEGLKQEFGTDVYIILDLQTIGVNTRIKKGLIRVISIMYLGFAFLLFAGNYAIYVISKKWLQVVLMARYHIL
jgi:hypothetical protein